MNKFFERLVFVNFAILSMMMIFEVQYLKFQLEILPLKWEIEKCLNSKEAKAVEKWNENVKAALNERGVQEAGVCSDQR